MNDSLTYVVLDWKRIVDEYVGGTTYRAYIGGDLWVEIRKNWEGRPRRDGKGGFWSARTYDPDVFDEVWDVVLMDRTGEYEYIVVNLRTLGDAKLAVGMFLQ